MAFVLWYAFGIFTGHDDFRTSLLQEIEQRMIAFERNILSELKKMMDAACAPPRQDAGDKKRVGGYLGLVLDDLSIKSVLPGSPAEELGFKAGDVLANVGAAPVRNGDDFIQKLWTNRAAKGISVRRSGKAVEIPACLSDLEQTALPGEKAPDFTLKTADGAKNVRLHDHIGKKPVVLVFGSYT